MCVRTEELTDAWAQTFKPRLHVYYGIITIHILISGTAIVIISGVSVHASLHLFCLICVKIQLST